MEENDYETREDLEKAVQEWNMDQFNTVIQTEVWCFQICCFN